MIRKFQCKHCNRTFEANDAYDVTCPYCKSDNITPWKPSFAKYIYAALALIIVFGITFAITRLVHTQTADNRVFPQPPTEPIDDVTIGGGGPSIDSKITEQIPVSITIQVVNQPQLNKSTMKYALKVVAKGVPAGVSYHFELLDAFNDTKAVAKSNDGNFVEIPASKADGIYNLIVVGDNESLYCEKKPIGGFVEVAVIDSGKKMTEKELQDKINSHDPSLLGKNDYLSSSYSVTCTNLKEGDTNVSNIGQIFEKFTFDIWSSVEVTSVKYDEMNQIKAIVIKAIYVD